MNQEELNEVGTLLHIWESIAQNHPNLQAIGRQCLRRLQEIEAEAKEAEIALVEEAKQAEAERQAQDYQQPDDEPELDENGNHIQGSDALDEHGKPLAPIERRV